MIRILCVFATLNRGGAESMCMNLYRVIDREKIQFDFVKHTNEHCSFEDEIESLGGVVYTAPKFNYRNIARYKKWWRVFFSTHPDYRIIHGHYFTISHIYFKIAHEFGVITVGHSHSQQANYRSLKFAIKRIMTKWIEKESDYCLACSKAAGEYLFPHKEYYVLHNAIDSAAYTYDPVKGAEVREELGINDNQIIIGVCGSFTVPKNPMGILQIFDAIHHIRPDTMLLWVGDGDLRPAIENRIEELESKESIILTGMRSDVNRLMQVMDVFILPSLWEGVAVVSIEAQAAGLPCFFSDKVSQECNITDLCHFLPLDQPWLWAKEVDSLLRHNKPRKNTRKEIEQAGYDAATTAEWLKDFYLKIIDENVNNRSKK